MAGLTYVNQIGAVEGMNQAGPGTLIPDTFLRWAQDILVDRAGLMRRRGPFSNITTYKSVSGVFSNYDPISSVSADYEIVLGLVSTYDPVGVPRIGMIVNSYKSSVCTTILRVFSSDFVYLGCERLISNSFIPDLSIVSAKPALGGGVWISVAGSQANPANHFQFFWRGGYNNYEAGGVPPTSLTFTNRGSFSFDGYPDFDTGHNAMGTTVGLATGPTGPSISNVSSGMFLFVSMPSSYTVTGPTGSTYTASTKIVSLTTTTPHNLMIGDNISVTGAGSAFNTNSTYVMTIPSSTTFTYYNTGGGASNATATTGTITNIGVTAGDYYAGVVKSVNTNNTFVLDKAPYVWDPNITNNHNLTYTITNTSATSTVETVTIGSGHTLEVGDQVIVSTPSNILFDTWGAPVTVTSVGPTGASPYTTFTFNKSGATGTSPSSGTVLIANSLGLLANSVTGVSNTVPNLTFKFTSVRPFIHKHGRGVLTVPDEGVGTIISGTEGTAGDGHWAAANVIGYNLYRASDNAYYGKILSTNNADGTTSNTTAQLYQDCGAFSREENYIMMPTTPIDLVNGFTVNNRSANEFGGLYTAVYAGYQWFGNLANSDKDHNRIVFSAYHDREAVDLSPDAADSIVFPGKSRFRGMGAAQSGLLVFLDDRTYIVRGNDRTNFSVEQLIPEGCLSPSSIVEWGGGVFWAGKSGIMFYDGASVRNLTKDNLGLYYHDSLNYFNPDVNRVIAFMHKNNLVMHFTSWDSPYKPDRYEPIYASTWQGTPALAGRTSNSLLDPASFAQYGYTAEDFDGRNTPIYWERHTLNKSASSGSTGKVLTFGARISAFSGDGTKGTFTIDGGPNGHQFKVGDVVTIGNLSGTNGLLLNGTQTITDVVSGTSIKIATTYTTNVTVNATSGNLSYMIKDPASIWYTTPGLYKWGPITNGTSITFNIYMPTNALTVFTNLDYRGHTNVETVNGLKTLLGVNSVETISNTQKLRARFIDMETVYDTHTNGPDPLLVEKINIPYSDLVLGPDLFLQTRHFTVGDHTLRKWFQRIIFSMLLYDGALRMDVVDDDDNDMVDVNEKKHQYWDVFTEEGYSWDYMTTTEFPKLASPNVNNWDGVNNTSTIWDDVFMSEFSRYASRVSWRKSSLGFRLYQLNKYRLPYNSVVTLPNRIEIHSFSIGFKALRQGRV